MRLHVRSRPLDALSSLPTTVVADVPTSLRVTALVLVAMLGAPPVDPDLFFEQRGLTFLLLMCAAVFGLHEQEIYPRIADAIYSLVGGWAIVVAYARAAPKVEERGYDGKGQRENMAALAAALLAYAGARVVRAGATHAGMVVGFTESHEDFATRGYAMADDVVASALVFGGVACVGAAVVVFLNHDAIYEHGCAPVSNVLGMLSVLVFSGAFVAQVMFYARVDELSAIFGDNSCDGSTDVCSASIRARRLHVANATPATLWACAVRLVLFAFPHARRCRSRSLYFRGCKDDYEYEEGRTAVAAASNATGWTAVFASLVALVVVFAISDHTATLASVEVLLLYGSIPLAWFGAAWLATAVHFAGLVLHVIHKTGTVYGFDLSYLTHWTVLLTLLLLAVLTVTMLIAFLLYDSLLPRPRRRLRRHHHRALDRGADVDPARADARVPRRLRRLRRRARLLGLQQLARLRHAVVDAALPELLLRGRARRRALRVLAPGGEQPVAQNLVVYDAGPHTGGVGDFADRQAGRRPYEQVADPLALVVATLGALVPWGVIGYYLC